jgi:hypothetical protein
MKNNQASASHEDLAALSSLIFGGLTFLSGTFAVWSLTASLRVTKSFAVSTGLFSNWLVWTLLALAAHQIGRQVERELTDNRIGARVRIMRRRVRRAASPNDTTAAAA